MNTYRIMNRLTKEWWDGEAESAQEACQKADWVIGDCWVRERTPVIADPTSESGHRGGGWKNSRRHTVKLEKAIEIKQKYQYILQDASFPELIEADNLSIKALERIKEGRSQGVVAKMNVLPGETK